MCRFSVIVPLIGSLDRFEETLASVLRHSPAGSQIVVVHDGSYEDPYELNNEIQFVEADKEAGLVNYFNIGLCYVAGQFTLLVRPGVEFAAAWENEVCAAFADENVAAAASLIVAGPDSKRIVSAGVDFDASGTRRLVGAGKKNSRRNCRTLRPVGPTSSLAAYRTSVLKSVAPLDESLSAIYMDLDIAMSMKTLGFETVLADGFVGVASEPEAISGELAAVHGASAQRASSRYSGLAPANIFSNMMFDLVRIPMATWRLQHLMQRRSASKFVDQDLQHSNRLERLAAEKPWATTVEPTQLTEELFTRRAA